MSDDIRIERDGKVALITINRESKMNSLDFNANQALVDVWRSFAEDATYHVAVITGAGRRAFCAGADLKTYTMNFATTPASEFRKRFTDGPGFAGITRNLTITKPIVAAINGFAISGGLELALACDIRFCSENAVFALQDVRWGFHACDGGLIRLKEIVGLGHAMELILSGDQIDATHAARIGLVNRIFRENELLEQSLAYAQHLASQAPLPQQFAKDVMRRIEGMSQEEALRLESTSFRKLGDTKDLLEGTNAFREKRMPTFEGR